MNQSLAVIVRYLVSWVIMIGVAKGWWSEAFGGQIGDILVNVIATLLAGAFPAYALLKIDNGPKKPAF